jgi:hypothetical protein
MSVNAIERDFQRKVCRQISVESEGSDRFRVFTPFLFDDGDHLAIVLKRAGHDWELTDEGHTYMHLTYDIAEQDLNRGSRQGLIAGALEAFRVQDRNGELFRPVLDDRYGDALYDFVQALLHVSDVTYLSRERVRSTFLEDFESLIRNTVPEGRLAFDWQDPDHDPEGNYQVDCRVNGAERPLFLYALPNDDRVRDATISLLQFERWDIPFRAVGIFENQEDVNRKVLARFSDVCDKQFSSLAGNNDRITRYVSDAVER